jgi:hypothetical protein
MRGSACLPGAQFSGKAAKIFGVVVGYADGYPSQPARLRGTLLTHQRASRWGFAPTTLSRAASSIARDATTEAIQGIGETGETAPRAGTRAIENTQKL